MNYFTLVGQTGSDDPNRASDLKGVARNRSMPTGSSMRMGLRTRRNGNTSNQREFKGSLLRRGRPTLIIGDDTDWRFPDELKRELTDVR